VDLDPSDHMCAFYCGIGERDQGADPVPAGRIAGRREVRMIVDVSKTDKKLLLGGLVLENHRYVTANEFRTTRS
jgi:hypothetical protein